MLQNRAARANKPTAGHTYTRSKRRIVINEPNDENENPFAPSEKVAAHFKISKSAIDVYEDGKDNNTLTASPHTPRHRDALSKKVPITPRHRVLLRGGVLSPGTPKTPATPATAATQVYNRARQLFSGCSHPGKLVGRDGERKELSAFVDACLASKSGGCLYVSGPPGTGKSALVAEATERYKGDANVKMSVINCMSICNAKDFGQKLSEDLGAKSDVGFENLRKLFVRGKGRDNKKYVVILDEVDRLVELDLEVLYGLFEWSMQASSRLILIGIANALDLTDRFLPRLKGRNLKPELLPIMPYTAAQISEVLISKLKSLLPGEAASIPLLHPAAIQFCAKKVAAQTGDLRKAFDICRRAIDLVDQETREQEMEKMLQDSPTKTPLMENVNLSSPSPPKTAGRTKAALDTAAYTLDTAPKATIAHIARVTAHVFGNGTTQRLSTLNLQQKAVLCALAALEKKRRETQVERCMFSTPSKSNHTAPTVKQLFEAYSSLCKRDKLLHALTSLEFRDVVSGLETLSLLTGVDGKNGSFAVPSTPSRTPSRRGRGGGFGTTMAVGDERRMASTVGMKELSASLEGAGGELLKDILRGDGLL